MSEEMLYLLIRHGLITGFKVNHSVKKIYIKTIKMFILFKCLLIRYQKKCFVTGLVLFCFSYLLL